jgi:hypothetical protein
MSPADKQLLLDSERLSQSVTSLTEKVMFSRIPEKDKASARRTLERIVESTRGIMGDLEQGERHGR